MVFETISHKALKEKMLVEVHVGLSAYSQPQTLHIVPTYEVFQPSYVDFSNFYVARGKRHESIEQQLVCRIIV